MQYQICGYSIDFLGLMSRNKTNERSFYFFDANLSAHGHEYFIRKSDPNIKRKKFLFDKTCLNQ